MEQYEKDALTRVAAAKAAAAAKGKAKAKADPKAKANGKSSSVLKRPAAAPAHGGVMPAKVTVNIKEIMKKQVVDACTKDAFMRKGWTIGLKVAQGKGLDKDDPVTKMYTSTGYANAKAYLESVGAL